MTAIFLPAVRFIRFSVSERASVLSFICIRRSLPRLYCIVSESPRRLSSTNPLKSPEPVRNSAAASAAVRPLPLNLDVMRGMIIPTARYARSARIPIAGWKEPINRHITAV